MLVFKIICLLKFIICARPIRDECYGNPFAGYHPRSTDEQIPNNIHPSEISKLVEDIRRRSDSNNYFFIREKSTLDSNPSQPDESVSFPVIDARYTPISDRKYILIPIDSDTRREKSSSSKHVDPLLRDHFYECDQDDIVVKTAPHSRSTHEERLEDPQESCSGSDYKSDTRDRPSLYVKESGLSSIPVSQKLPYKIHLKPSHTIAQQDFQTQKTEPNVSTSNFHMPPGLKGYDKKILIQRFKELKHDVDRHLSSLKQDQRKREGITTKKRKLSCTSNDIIKTESEDEYQSEKEIREVFFREDDNLLRPKTAFHSTDSHAYPESGSRSHRDDKNFFENITDRSQRESDQYGSRSVYFSKSPEYFDRKVDIKTDKTYEPKDQNKYEDYERIVRYDYGHGTKSHMIKPRNFDFQEGLYDDTDKNKLIDFGAFEGCNPERKIYSTELDKEFKDKIENLINYKRRKNYQKYTMNLTSSEVYDLLLMHFNYNKVDIVLFFVIYNFLTFGFTTDTNILIYDETNMQFEPLKGKNDLTKKRIIELIHAWKKRNLKFITAEQTNYIIYKIFEKIILNVTNITLEFSRLALKSSKIDCKVLWGFGYLHKW